MRVRFLRRNSAAATDGDTDVSSDDGELVRGHTPGKGRPTPKRRDAEGRKRGPAPPPPKSTREAMRRARGTKDERRAMSAQRRSDRVERAERMKSGDEKYMLPRDRGPVKAFIRDYIDARRNLLGLFMPLALVVMVSIFAQSVVIQQYATLASLLVMTAMVIEGILLGRRLSGLARQRFPKENIRGFSTGWYAFVRASQIRKLRVPKPRVKPGDKV